MQDILIKSIMSAQVQCASPFDPPFARDPVNETKPSLLQGHNRE